MLPNHKGEISIIFEIGLVGACQASAVVQRMGDAWELQ